MLGIRRREFIAALGGAAAWPLAARAQQAAVPLVGWLSSRSPDVEGPLAAAFRKGLSEIGYVEGRNLAIESHWAYGRPERFPALAAELLHREVSVMVTAGIGRAGIDAVRAVNPTIPIVFTTAVDPVHDGMVSSLSRPTGNITGVATLSVELGPKEIELLHEMVPQATSIALLANPVAGDAFPAPAIVAAAQTLGLTLHPLRAGDERDIDDAVAALPKLGAGGLVIQIAPLFTTRVDKLAALTLRHRMPAIYPRREFPQMGGLVSYGSNLWESNRLAGTYVGRILKGEKPANLPVQQVTKIELVINLKTAKALGIMVPLPLSGRADEVIE
jgi:putative tryptophan/tyrosine transport system substrate-binding protein